MRNSTNRKPKFIFAAGGHTRYYFRWKFNWIKWKPLIDSELIYGDSSFFSVPSAHCPQRKRKYFQLRIVAVDWISHSLRASSHMHVKHHHRQHQHQSFDRLELFASHLNKRPVWIPFPLHFKCARSKTKRSHLTIFIASCFFSRFFFHFISNSKMNTTNKCLSFAEERFMCSTAQAYTWAVPALSHSNVHNKHVCVCVCTLNRHERKSRIDPKWFAGRICFSTSCLLSDFFYDLFFSAACAISKTKEKKNLLMTVIRNNQIRMNICIFSPHLSSIVRFRFSFL